MSSDEDDDDPFACFGDDNNDSEEEEEEAENESNQNDSKQNAEKARILMENANNKTKKSEQEEQRSTDKDDVTDEEVEEEIVLPLSLNLWPSRPPLYKGPISFIDLPAPPSSSSSTVSSITNAVVGGARGVIATKDLTPGTLLLVEEPIFTWPEEQIGKALDLSSIYGIITSKNAEKIVHDLELLHPTKKQVDAALQANKIDLMVKVQILDMVQMLEKQTNETLEQRELLKTILKIAKDGNINNSNGKPISKDDIYRLLLVLRYNGFTSGVYLHFALINHDDNPNCIKYTPPSSSSHDEEDVIYSEVRTTKYVKRGESLTLHYLNPREVSHCTKRMHLWDQHRFDIGDTVNREDELYQLELVHNAFPPSYLAKEDGDSEERPTKQVEKTMNELEDLRVELQNRLTVLQHQQISSSSSDKAGYNKQTSEVLEYIKALEVSSQEIITTTITEKLGNPTHILLARCYRLHLDTCEMLLPSSSSIAALDSKLDDPLTTTQKHNLMVKFLTSAYKLLQIQHRYLGEHHPDVARSCKDIATSIQYLLSASPKSLTNSKEDLFGDGTRTFGEWSKKENDFRKKYEFVSGMYPREDVECIVKEECDERRKRLNKKK